LTTYQLQASDRTVGVGLIDQAYRAVLTVDSGDEVCLSTCNLWGGEVPYGASFEEVMQVRQRHPGTGPPHSITGSIAIRGARIGRVLWADIRLLDVGPSGLNRTAAYRLCSLAADLIVTQVVSGNQGIHVRLPRACCSGDSAPASNDFHRSERVSYH
jgi:acetamidase/formamidase